MDKYLIQPHFKKSQYYPFNKTGGRGDSHDSGFAKLCFQVNANTSMLAILKWDH